MKKNKLHNITSPGYKTPQHYFESFEDRFFNDLNTNNEGVKTSGYAVPKDYFNTIDDVILNKIKAEEKSIISFKSRTTFYYIAGIAASLVLMFSIVFNNDNVLSFDALDTASIENYVYQEDYSNDELASLFMPNEISETDFIDITVSDETLNEYLETLDTEDLLVE